MSNKRKTRAELSAELDARDKEEQRKAKLEQIRRKRYEAGRKRDYKAFLLRVPTDASQPVIQGLLKGFEAKVLGART